MKISWPPLSLIVRNYNPPTEQATRSWSLVTPDLRVCPAEYQIVVSLSLLSTEHTQPLPWGYWGACQRFHPPVAQVRGFSDTKSFYIRFRHGSWSEDLETRNKLSICYQRTVESTSERCLMKEQNTRHTEATHNSNPKVQLSRSWGLVSQRAMCSLLLEDLPRALLSLPLGSMPWEVPSSPQSLLTMTWESIKNVPSRRAEALSQPASFW